MAILGVIFNFFYVAFFVMCGTMGYLGQITLGAMVGYIQPVTRMH